MADLKSKYGTTAQAITVTLASLATGNARASTVIDNSSDLFLDVLVQLRIELQAGTPGSDKAINVYVYGTSDTGTPLYTDGVTGTDAAFTPTEPTNLILLGNISAPTSAGIFTGGPWSIAAAFGGSMPQKWGIVVRNRTNISFHGTEGNHKKIYQGIYAQQV